MLLLVKKKKKRKWVRGGNDISASLRFSNNAAMLDRGEAGINGCSVNTSPEGPLLKVVQVLLTDGGDSTVTLRIFHAVTITADTSERDEKKKKKKSHQSVDIKRPPALTNCTSRLN